VKQPTVRSRRQRLGQHFLANHRVAATIAAALADEPPRVLEIGPGRGALTRPLLERFPRVRAVELDAHLAETLASRLGDPAGLEVWRGDALHEDLEEMMRDGPWQVAGNLPYAVATPMVRRLVRWAPAIPRMVVMVQREVAERFLAPPGNPHRGLVSVEMELFARSRRLFDVPPGAFSPPPRVVSTVLVIAPQPPPEPPAVVEGALRLAGAAFTQRRKKLLNSLAEAAPKTLLHQALAEAGCEGGWRPQEVEAGRWLLLARALAKLYDGRTA